MATQTPNLKLDLREAADIFNPLSTNANFETLDTVITEIRKKGGLPTYTTTASANLLKLSENPTPNETLFKFVAAGDANTWSYQETVNNIVSLDGNQKTVKAGEMYVAWVNAANAMVVIAWPDVVNAQTFDGKGPAEWASKVQLDAVNQTAANATTTAQAAATVANNALEKANNALEMAKAAGMRTIEVFRGYATRTASNLTTTIPDDAKLIVVENTQYEYGISKTGTGDFTLSNFVQTGMNTAAIFSYSLNLTKNTVKFNTGLQMNYEGGNWSYNTQIDAAPIAITVFK